MPRCLLLLLLAALPSLAEVKEGEFAPPVQLQDADGTDRDVAESFGHWTALVFYPKDDTPGCTTEACSIRDQWEAIEQADVHIYGISIDPVNSKHNFEAKHGLKHVLLADETKAVCTAYGTLNERGFSNRITFILDPARIVRFINRQVRPQQAAQDILAKVAELSAADAEAALGRLGQPLDTGLGVSVPVPDGWTIQPEAGGQAMSWVHPQRPEVNLMLAAMRPEPDTLTIDAMREAVPAGVEAQLVEAVTVGGAEAVRVVGITGDGQAVAGVRFITGDHDFTLSLTAPAADRDAAARLLAAVCAGIDAG